jgi:hypothetical protein
VWVCWLIWFARRMTRNHEQPVAHMRERPGARREWSKHRNGIRLCMKSESLFRLMAVIAALHVAVFSYFFGLRNSGYILAATLSATLIWAMVFLLSERKRRRSAIVGVVVGLIFQQVAYQAWKTELPGFWWSLAQFGALQFLIAYGIGRTVP